MQRKIIKGIFKSNKSILFWFVSILLFYYMVFIVINKFSTMHYYYIFGVLEFSNIIGFCLFAFNISLILFFCYKYLNYEIKYIFEEVFLRENKLWFIKKILGTLIIVLIIKLFQYLLFVLLNYIFNIKIMYLMSFFLKNLLFYLTFAFVFYLLYFPVLIKKVPL